MRRHPGEQAAERAAAHYRAGIARIEDRWSGRGNPGTRFDDPHHVYAADLDLFGPGNLFELLSIARTRMGENALAAWLLSPAAVATVQERQECGAERQGDHKGTSHVEKSAPVLWKFPTAAPVSPRGSACRHRAR